MNADWLNPSPMPRKRLRRFWWRHSTDILLALLVLAIFMAGALGTWALFFWRCAA